MAFLFRRKLKHPVTKVIKIVYYIQWYDHNKKIKKLSTGKSLLSEARQVFNEWEKSQSLSADSNIFLSEMIKEILAYVNINLKSSYNLYEYALRMFLEITGNKKLKLITVYDIEKYKSVRLLQQNKNNPLLKINPMSVNKEIRCIKSAFNKAVEIGLINDHKIFKAKLISIPKTNQRSKYSNEEINLIISNLQNENILRAVLIAINTGLRLNEIINLQIKDIDLNNRIIFIHNKSDIGFKTKTSQERIIPINNKLLNYFNSWLGINSNITEINSENNFIVNYDGKKYRKDTISNKFRLLLKKLNLPGSFHCLRHTFASELISKGTDIQTVKELLGHSRIETTSIYLHSTNKLKFEAVERI